MTDISRWKSKVNSYDGKLLVFQTNPGDDSNAVMVCGDESPEFVLASDYDTLKKLLNEVAKKCNGELGCDGYLCYEHAKACESK